MFILRNILTPLQNEYSSTPLGRKPSRWFVYVLLAFIVPFTSSISSNILRCLNTLFGLHVNRRRFYTFMGSNKLPWENLCRRLWDRIPNPTTDGRLLVALDDFINPKTGRKIFGCAHIFDHAAKGQPVQISMGAECGSRWFAETYQGPLGVSASCPPILSTEKSDCVQIR
jgi:hypothetical protein